MDSADAILTWAPRLQLVFHVLSRAVARHFRFFVFVVREEERTLYIWRFSVTISRTRRRGNRGWCD